MFDLKSATISRAIFLEKVFSTSALHRLILILFAAMVAFAGLWAVAPTLLGESRIFGLFLMAASSAFGFWAYNIYYVNRVRVVRADPADINVANHLDFVAAFAVSRYLGRKEGLSRLLEEILKIPGSEFVFFRLGVNPRKVKDLLEDYLQNNEEKFDRAEFELFMEESLALSRGQGRELITWRHMLVTLAVHSEFLRKFIFEKKIEKKDLLTICDWQRRIEEASEDRKKFWRRKNLFAHQGIAKGWSSGYTITLDKYAYDLSKLALKRSRIQLYGRKGETEQIERILARAGENNVIVVGDEGVGKKTIVTALAMRIFDGDTLPQLAFKRVMELDVAAVLAGSGNIREVESRFKKILNEAVRAGNVILLIDNIENLFARGSGGAGEVDATELLLPYLKLPTFQVIGLTNYDQFHDTISRNPAVMQNFAKVEVHEPAPENVEKILEDVVPQIEAHSHVLITYQAMKDSVTLTNRYIKDQPFPEKAIDVLQEAAVYARAQRKSPMVIEEDIEEVVHRKTEIPVGKMALAEKEVLLDLEKILHRRVVGQDEAIVAIANSMRRARSGIASEKKPIGSFLFLGPTGVGKTETAKTLASVYFGSEKRMLRFDMSEYQEQRSLFRLIGGENERGLLTQEVIENPFSLILLDEVEKAHKDILNVFLQVLDDGRLTDSSGKTVDFTNTIIIATSNAGAEMIRQAVQEFHEVNLKERLVDYLQKQGLFKPEFLNRFDAVITFKPLNEDQTAQVAELLLQELNKRLKAKDIQIKITPELVKKIAKIGYSPEYGARPLRRAIQDKIEDIVARKLLSEEIKRGDTLEINPDEIQ